MGARVLAAAGAVVLLLSGCTVDVATSAAGLSPCATSPRPPVERPRPAAPEQAPPGPAADGIGDSYFPRDGNGGYDVASYDLDVAYAPATGVLTGTAVITATAIQGLTRFNLDLHGLELGTVAVDGTPATAQRAGDELEITPAATIPVGTRFAVKITYSGVPEPYREDGEEIGFLRTADGAIAIGEPDVAASWFPVNDHPRDKATYTIKITAPDGLTSISNGVRTSSTSAGGRTATVWSVTKPMASYLATMVIGNYRLQETTHDGLPVIVAVAQSLPTTVDAQLARTGEIVDFLDDCFGPYPFDALGGIVISDQRIGFALENQTRPIYTSGFFTNRDGTSVIAHELAHQWYGDSVSVHDWREIWLNEGFATYGEWMWSEKATGVTVQATFDRLYAPADAAMWGVPPGDPGAARLFSQSVYVRGGMTLHALRTTVGDEKFFTILKSWAADKAGGSGTTKEFIELAERISGRQLDQFFDDWLYQPTRPPKP